MPNWCNNVLTITHPDPAKIASAKDAFAEGKFMNSLVPVPEDLQITAGYLGNGDEQKALEAKEQANLEKYGVKNWYDFCVAKWGTKWDVGTNDGINDFDDHSLVVCFDSAWSPPIAFYDKITEMGFTVEAYYYESGMGFVGKWQDGDDEFYDLSGLDSSTVAATIGNELDEMFGISESMAEYEEENKDEVVKWWEQGVKELGLENA